ncbi:cell wall metabolism sensor histidine kinase WalK [Nocardioides sp. R-C-SC26]|uniref:sensor histidine kinase n=1 Tax=Nocardioides sp. R-C-SC26 TaxID=2870414 RepID=UPI001E659603|nr:HAMP domain-containing sensor histidine kinase [Nocardioides sp. R-C-SC26]
MKTLFASLSARLVVATVGLVVVVSVLVGGVTTLAMRAYLTDQLDDDVAAAARRAQFDVAFAPDGANDPFRSPLDRPRPDEAGPVGQGVGTVSARYSDGELTGEVLLDSDRGAGTWTALDDGVIDALRTVPADGEAHAVELPGLGSYRVLALTTRSGGIVLGGLPDDDVRGAVSALVLREALLIAIGGALAAAAGLLLVRRQLRPLREVAATAHSVAARPLDSGSIGVTERVPDHLTDEATEVGQVGAALNSLLAHVETSLDARHASEQRVRQFVADASHELRTPLTTIAGYAELAGRHPDDIAAQATAVAKVAEESSRMTALVEDLLLLARLDSGRPLVREPVDLTRLALEAVADARVLDAQRRWQLDLPDEAVEVVGDEQRLHQALTNLLANARKYTPPGTTVTVSVRVDGFAVHDDGPGFPPQLVPHAFERFARGDAARHREGGVGLGLSLVEAIVAAHGGAVRLSSRPGDTSVDVVLAAGEQHPTDIV